MDNGTRGWTMDRRSSGCSSMAGVSCAEEVGQVDLPSGVGRSLRDLVRYWAGRLLRGVVASASFAGTLRRGGKSSHMRSTS